MRRLHFSLLTVSAFIFSIIFMAGAATAQEPPPSIAAVPKDDDYAFLEAPEDHVLGSETAPNTLIIYASVTCPHCSNWFKSEWDLLKSELIDAGELRVVFREFITAPAQVAAAGFTIANCTQNDNYMEVIRHQMFEQSNIIGGLQEGKGIEVYDSTLKLAGMSTDDIAPCFENPAHLKRLETSMARATAGELEAVPGFILNGQLYSGQATAKTLSDIFKSGVSAP